MLLPIYWENNRLFVENGQVWGVYRLPRLPYEWQSQQKMLSAYRQLEVFFHSYVGQGQILMVTRPLSRSVLMRELSAFSNHPYWATHVEAAATRATTVTERAVFLLVPLGKSRSIAWDTLVDRPDQVSARVRERLSRYLRRQRITQQVGGASVITESEIRQSILLESRMRNQLSAWIPSIAPATPSDIEWLYRAPYYRGLTDMPRVFDELPRTMTALGDEMVLFPTPLRLALRDGVVVEDTFRLRVRHADHRESHQALFGVAAMPAHVESLGDEWLYRPFEQMPTAVDAAVHFEIISPQRARDLVERRRKIAQSQGEEYAAVGDVPWDVYDGLESAQALQAKVKAGMPLARFHVFFAVAGSTEDEMMRAENQIKERLSGWLTLVHPPGEAMTLFRAFFPCETTGAEKAWSIPGDPSVLACSGALGTTDVGDPTGQWFGYNLYSGRPVFVDWYRPMRELNRTGTVAFIGTLGSGKSVAMKYAIHTLLSWGAVGVIVDPKAEEYAPLLDLWKSNHASMWWRFGPNSDLQFSPFVLGRDARESSQVAEGFLSVLLNITTNERGQRSILVIRRALSRLYAGTRYDMPAFLDELAKERSDMSRGESDREIADRYYELLSHYETDPVGKAIFGQGDIGGQPALTLASVSGLDFPAPTSSPDAWREAERFGVSILYLITQLSFKRLLALPTSRKKFFAIDEAWLLRSIPEGRALLNTMTLMGRSMNLVLLMAFQNPDVALPKSGEANDDLTANIGWFFIGRLTSRTQVQYAVQLLGLPESGNHEERFAQFSNGRGFLKDPLGRIGEVQIDVLPRELLAHFGTTPG